MRPTIALLGGAGPAGFNVLRAWNAMGRDLRVVAYDHNPVHLEMIPRFAHLEIVKRTMQGFDAQAIAAQGALLVHAQPDPLVRALSEQRHGLPTLMPERRTIDLCQDKFESARVWAAASLCKEPVLVAFRGDLTAAEDRIGYPCWIRARSGAGARHASPADSRDVAGMWIHYLTHRFGAEDLVVQPYLPGRDYAVTTLWWRGSLVASLVRERLSYLYPQHAVSGRTGTPVVARILAGESAERPFTAAVGAVHAVAQAAGEAAHGIMCVDLREDTDGIPVPTEINAGRFFTTSHVGEGVGVNIPALYLLLALGELDYSWFTKPTEVDPKWDGTLVLRHMDTGTKWIARDAQSESVRRAVEEMRA